MAISFKEFCKLCERVESITSTLEITDVVADFLRKLDEEDLKSVPLLLMGSIFPEWDERDLGVGPSTIFEAVSSVASISKEQLENLIREHGDAGIAVEEALKRKPKSFLIVEEEEELLLKDVYRILVEISEISGNRSVDRKLNRLKYLYSTLSPFEARYLTRILLKELRIGVGEGIMRDAIARAFGVSPEEIERAYMLTNDFSQIAVALRRGGVEELRKLKMVVGRPVKMMLAQTALGLEEGLKEHGMTIVERKYDGARVQIHKDGDRCVIFSRRLENVTNSLPDLKEASLELPFNSAILDGEVIALQNGKPAPFQVLLRRFRRKYEIEEMEREIPIHAYIFDILYEDGEILIDLPLKERKKRIEKIGDGEIISFSPYIVTSDFEEAERFYRMALEEGHEGVMLKNPESPYTPGKRGKHWLKVKPIMETLDLAVIGGEWGEGRRASLIGSYLLGARDERGNLIPVGKVATGLTDEMLRELTERLKPLIIKQEGRIVEFKPEIVFEVGYEEIQKSPKYPAGYALRFPRLIRVREDKSVDEVDSLERVRELYELQKRK
ncbi:MAG: ATP-dependent DNA ligase [Archaeoglobi archaeon]|nr:ATP-dependent DNA ligase [Candidatus Mnemosynella bozhongmuii]